MGTKRGGTLIHALKKRLREREREDRSRVARPPNLLYIALCGLASLPFLLTPRRLYPCSKRPRSMRVHAKRKKQASRQAKKQMEEKACWKQIRKRCQTGAKKYVKHTKRKTNMLSNKRGCPRRTNVCLNWVSIVPLEWSMDNTQTHAWTCRQACKRCKDAKKAKWVAQSKQGKQINIARSGEKCVSSTPTPQRCVSQVVTPKQTLGRTDATTQSKWL